MKITPIEPPEPAERRCKDMGAHWTNIIIYGGCNLCGLGDQSQIFKAVKKEEPDDFSGATYLDEQGNR